MLNKRLLWIATAALILVLSQFTSTEIASAEGTVPDPQAPTLLVGPISEIVDDNIWRVVSVTVDVSQARLNQRVDVAQEGNWVRIEGESNGPNSLVAHRVKVLPQQPFIRVRGTLDSIDDTTVVVDQISLARTSTTFVAGNPTPGFPVMVRAAEESTGSLLALQVVGGGFFNDDDDDDDDDSAEGDIELTGYVQLELDDGWQVSGIPVVVTDQTRIETRVGELAPGAWVKVDAISLDDGHLQALRIRTIAHRHEHKLEGTLTDLLDDEVIVEGITLPLSDDVKIEDDPVAGDEVEVKGTLPDLDAGIMLVVKIEGKDHDHGDDDHDSVVRFVGRISLIPDGYVGDWEIGGRTVFVDDPLLVDEHKATAAVGGLAKVKAVRQGTPSTLRAIEVIVLPARAHDDDDDDDDHGNRFVRFRGDVDDRPSDDVLGEWLIDGQRVQVDEHTKIHDADRIDMGSFVEVKGYRAHDSDVVQAREVKLKDRDDDHGHGHDEVEFTGPIQDLPSDGLRGLWLVDGKDVKVTEHTEIEDRDEIGIGVVVKVEGKRLPNGIIKATEIEVDDD